MNTATLTTGPRPDEENVYCETCGEVLTADEFPQCTKCQADADAVYCDCGVALTDDDIDNTATSAPSAMPPATSPALDCNETLDNDERSTKCKTRCLGCQESERRRRARREDGGHREEARDLLESNLIDGDLAGLKKIAAALTRLQPG